MKNQMKLWHAKCKVMTIKFEIMTRYVQNNEDSDEIMTR
jgi:hypothetical protein